MIQLAAFYGVCLWLVPLLLLLSLAVGDHVLPSMGSGDAAFVTPAVMPKGKFSVLSGSFRSLVGRDGEPAAVITPARILSASSSYVMRGVHED
ncbi:hypothetical protein, variant [Allomyces macrogynus ATCC 38327]|nr:hypothetical protein, variant [Allomyces macrogynus ATCC 38327]|eukprot:KNE59326.1 hypothetical protein, variant [Allomyces macrogynus ATCC 38327]